jgi:Skp family chaperone for outer membrane proteins
MSKVKQEYLDSIKEVQKNLQAIQLELGAIALAELRKKALLEAYADQEAKAKEVADSIQAEYGNGSVDLETGEFTEAPAAEAEVVE